MAGVQFDKQSAGRIAKVVQHVEKGIHGSTYREPRRTPQILGGGVCYFELTETLDADSSTGATAYKRTFSSSANGGEGGYETGTDEITVKDTREVGYSGVSGAKGACIMKTADNGAFGEIIDLECP